MNKNPGNVIKIKLEYLFDGLPIIYYIVWILDRKCFEIVILKKKLKAYIQFIHNGSIWQLKILGVALEKFLIQLIVLGFRFYRLQVTGQLIQFRLSLYSFYVYQVPVNSKYTEETVILQSGVIRNDELGKPLLCKFFGFASADNQEQYLFVRIKNFVFWMDGLLFLYFLRYFYEGF